MRDLLQRRSSTLPLRAAALSFWLLGLTLLSAPLVAEGEVVVLASGPKDGVYHRLAKAIRDRLEGDGLKVEIEVPLDCAENLDLLERGEARFAFAQQDVVSEYLRNHPTTRVRVVDRIFFDYLHIFLRESVHIDSVAELRQLRIWAGENETGTRYTASRFLDSIGIPLATLDDHLLTFEEIQNEGSSDPWIMQRAVERLPDWFRNNRLDAAVLLATPGTQDVCQLMLHGRCSLMSFDRRLLRRLTYEEEDAKEKGLLRQIVIAGIPAGTYVNQSQPANTIAVPVLLLSAEDEDPVLATKFRDTALHVWKELAERQDSAGCSLVPAPAAAEPLAPNSKLLEGVPREEAGRPWLFWKKFSGLVLAVIALCIGGLLYRTRRKLCRLLRISWIHYRSLTVIVIAMGVSVPLVTFATYLTENAINDNFSSIFESFWSITVYFFSGLEDRVPFTTQGRVFVTFGLLVGAVCSAIASAWVTRAILRKEKKMPKNMTDHYLILNCNERGPDIVRELHHEVLRKYNRTYPIVVLTDNDAPELKELTQLGNGREEAFEDVYLRSGNPTDETALRQANAEQARTILILADEKRGDEWTIRSILQLRRIARQCERKFHVMVELIDAENDFVLEELALVFPGLLERVSTRKLRNCLFSQAALNPGITDFFTDLLSMEDGANVVYAEPIPPEAMKKNFREHAADVILKAVPERPVIPVGVQRVVGGRAKVYTNPKEGDEGFTFREGDNLVLIAYDPPISNVLPAPKAQSAVNYRPDTSATGLVPEIGGGSLFPPPVAPPR